MIDRVEHSFDRSLATTPEFTPIGAPSSDMEVGLPSIDDFRWRASAESGSDAFGVVGHASESELADVVTYAPSPVPSGTLAFIDMEPEAHPVGVPAPIVNEDVASADEWATSATSAGSAQGAAAEAPDVSGASAETGLTPASEVPPAPPVSVPPAASADTWVSEERDAFDWKGVANLAATPDEERRAAEDWSSTTWERTSDSAQDHVAGLLAQVARRVRAGELPVHGSKQMSAEAALAAVLTALLSEESNEP
ncbi:MAG TPA: hypothetical protein VGT98_11715 [Candidatus Elarobacter sp.]|nr:hypothetical protein [Candidatus Elarobacter sp.]